MYQENIKHPKNPLLLQMLIISLQLGQLQGGNLIEHGMKTRMDIETTITFRIKF